MQTLIHVLGTKVFTPAMTIFTFLILTLFMISGASGQNGVHAVLHVTVEQKYGRGAVLEAVSYTHLDVYKRQRGNNKNNH